MKPAFAHFEIALALESAFFAAPLLPFPAAAPETTAEQPETRISRLQRWREKNPELFEARRVAGMKRSTLVRENIQRLHRECKDAWRASALKNPKLQATNGHIAAKEWVLSGPDGRIHRVRNLKKFIRDNPELFDEADVQWKHPEGKPQLSWCRAFQALSRLRPTCARPLADWEGWSWAARVPSMTPATPVSAPQTFREAA